LRVQDNSITRSEEKLHRYRALAAKYELRVKKMEKKHEERRKDRCSSAKELQIKREMVKSYKDKA
jgi:hypothetical protein